MKCRSPSWRGTWRPARPIHPRMVYDGGLLYMATEMGIVTCIDAKTGERVWRERLGGIYSASPVAADGKIYLVRRNRRDAGAAERKEARGLGPQQTGHAGDRFARDLGRPDLRARRPAPGSDRNQVAMKSSPAAPLRHHCRGAKLAFVPRPGCFRCRRWPEAALGVGRRQGDQHRVEDADSRSRALQPDCLGRPYFRHHRGQQQARRHLQTRALRRWRRLRR